MPDQSNSSGGDLNAAEIAVACRNIGFDVTCPACAGLFYTGTGFGTHTCDPPAAAPMTTPAPPVVEEIEQ